VSPLSNTQAGLTCLVGCLKTAYSAYSELSSVSRCHLLPLQPEDMSGHGMEGQEHYESSQSVHLVFSQVFERDTY